MKIKFILICLLCLLMCGCSAAGSIDNLLTPPKLLAEQDEIYRVLINSEGQGVKLKYPRSGDYRSAFVLHNIDDEPGDEALVFYENKNVQSGESALRLKILDKTEGKWEVVYDLACAGSEIDSISFTKLGGSEAVNIIICYTLLNQTEKVVSVIHYADKIPVELHSQSYSCLQVTDLNSDGMDELVTVSVNKVTQISVASMFTDGENGFEKLSETVLYGGAADYLRVTKGRLNENLEALFLDYSNGSGQSGTDVLYCYGNRLICPDSVGQSPSGIISRQINDYMAEIYCFDIDGDGFVEIPSTVPLPGYETLTKPEQLCAVQWYTVSEDSFIQKHYSYFSGKFRFALLFPNRWRGVVSAVADFVNNEIIFISYDAEDGVITPSEDNTLMRIRAVPKDDPEKTEMSKGLKLLGESEDTLFYCIETEDYKAGKLALTESELKDCFIKL